MLATFFGAPGAAELLAPTPCYAFPESPVRALGRAAAYSSWRSAPVESAPAFDDIDRGDVRRLVEEAGGAGWLRPDAIPAVLAAAGIPVISTEVVDSMEAARAATVRSGIPWC